jgi:hypothetical protein
MIGGAYCGLRILYSSGRLVVSSPHRILYPQSPIPIYSKYKPTCIYALYLHT